jgi:hypothetical protein
MDGGVSPVLMLGGLLLRPGWNIQVLAEGADNLNLYDKRHIWHDGVPDYSGRRLDG